MMSHQARDVDVIVVEAGHNGLVATCYLVKTGYNVTVVEASPSVGGMISTNPIFSGAPRHLINETTPTNRIKPFR